ncbi:MAG: RNA methyltransferase [Proteobacteria bacterium]|nr:RNA methyltransferase [Pseudomonadota bacterium]MBU1583450.1 RNA methyltransferase [Pseudomonadota bacterium]MBU2454348.1 RNA methyltransferase [Pseudomonadota bacterium]MBU2627768.1 RNA methyltransferase [Pseudomonadota bacterium]
MALIHFPVMNKKDQPIGSALTTIDLHDIARASITFGVKGFYVVTPYVDQALIATQVIEHWTKGVGGTLNPFRKKALELIQVTKTFEDAIALIEQERKEPVVTIATSAKTSPGSITTGAVRKKLENKASHVLVFGTAWGLANELIETCDFILDPILGNTEYNHLSVRSAASIYLDRIINGR